VRLARGSKLNSFLNHIRNVHRKVKLHSFKTTVVGLVKMVCHHDRIEHITCSNEEV
jgi:hypothetical protein